MALRVHWQFANIVENGNLSADSFVDYASGTHAYQQWRVDLEWKESSKDAQRNRINDPNCETMKINSLRKQLLLPVLASVVVSQIALIGVFGWLVARLQTREIIGRIEQVAQTLANASFPVNRAVLEQMRGLTGAEIFLVDERGDLLESTWQPKEPTLRWWDELPPSSEVHRLREQVITVAGQPFYAMAMSRRNLRNGSDGRLIILFPQAQYSDRQWQVIRPVLGLGALSLAATVVLISWLSTRVTRPIRELRTQVEHIADGQFPNLPINSSTLEVRELALAVQAMSGKLSNYEAKIRKTERLRLKDLLRSGIAHQLRNALAGAKMAVEIHAAKCQASHGGESLEIAMRQFRIMEQQLNKFLESPDESDWTRREIVADELLSSCQELLAPIAKHRGVRLNVEQESRGTRIHGDFDALQQLLVNLVTNGMDAALSDREVRFVDSGDDQTNSDSNLCSIAPCVKVNIVRLHGSLLAIQVWDNGPGVRESMLPQLFEPFVTDKLGGVGLGLWMARQIAERHQGEIRFQRHNLMTCFELIVQQTRACNGEPSAKNSGC